MNRDFQPGEIAEIMVDCSIAAQDDCGLG